MCFLSSRRYIRYSENADELVNLLHIKADEFQDKIDRYPDFYPTEGFIGSPFGYRKDPIDGTTRFHSGVDIGKRTGTPIFASGKGMVTFVGFEDGYGLYIIVNHGNGFSTLYAHLSSSNVNVGDFVGAGQTIGWVGLTGRTFGYHLHFETRVNGSTVDPQGYLW